MGLFVRWRRRRHLDRSSRNDPGAPDTAPPTMVRLYRDPRNPERLVHPHKVARTLHRRDAPPLDREYVLAECRAAEVDPERVFAELARLDALFAEGRLGGDEVKVKKFSFDPAGVVDFRPLGGSNWRVVGMGFYLKDRERGRLRYGWTVLRRESSNPHDANAVQVYIDGRLVGYLSAGKAKTYGPLLKEIGAQGYEVEPHIEGRKLRVALPPPSELKKLIAERRTD